MLRFLNELGPELPITDIGKGFVFTPSHAVPLQFIPSEKPIVAVRFIRQKAGCMYQRRSYICSTVIVIKQRQSISLRYSR